jgi:hypothetical protein
MPRPVRITEYRVEVTLWVGLFCGSELEISADLVSFLSIYYLTNIT